MDGEAVRKIEDLAVRANHIEKDGLTFVTGNYKVLGVVHESTVRFTTLLSFCGFINRNPQKLDFEGAIIVVNPDFSVALLSAPNPHDGERTVYAIAKRQDTEGFLFGRPYDTESFTIALKSRFVREDSDWEEVFNIVKKIQIDDKVEIEDDGISMKINLKQGVSSASIATVKKKTDHELRPYRIFPECEQPKSVFFLRLSGDRESGATVSLHETDGGKWKVDAAEIISTFVANGLSESVDIPIYC